MRKAKEDFAAALRRRCRPRARRRRSWRARPSLGQPGIPRSLERLTPKVRRLERHALRRSRAAARSSSTTRSWCPAPPAKQRAARAVRENWLSLGALIDQTFEQEDS